MARDSDVYEVKLRLYPIGTDPESSLGQLLMDAAYSSEAFSDWAAMLAWNLTIAALLCCSAERAYEQGCYDGIAPEAGYEDTYDCAYPDAARLDGAYSAPTVITFKP